LPRLGVELGPTPRTIAAWTGVDFSSDLRVAVLALVAPAFAQAPVTRLSIDYDDAGRTIARDFIGLSYEFAVVAANDFFTADNRTLLRLLHTLGSPAMADIVASWRPPARTASSSIAPRLRRTPGSFVLRTNTDIAPLDAMLCYKQLTMVEQAFRTTKSLFETRPQERRHGLAVPEHMGAALRHVRRQD
jgi:hypothetical protein